MRRPGRWRLHRALPARLLHLRRGGPSRRGPLHGIVGSPNDYAWSADDAAQIAAGWITRAESAAELAAALGIDPMTLEGTLQRYHAAVAAGRDDDFNRSPQTLVALATGGRAISGRYAAGAAGSIWGHLTEHGGGLIDAIAFGRIAGAEAAAIAAAAATGPG